MARLRLDQLVRVAPTPDDVDPENDDWGHEDRDDRLESAEANERDVHEPLGESKLRKQQGAVLSGPKYAGKRVSRRDLGLGQNNSDDDGGDDDKDDDDDDEEHDADSDEEAAEESKGASVGRWTRRPYDDDDDDDDDDDEDDDDEMMMANDTRSLTVPVDSSDSLLLELKGLAPAQISGAPASTMLTMITDPQEEVTKGQHVKQQLLLWDKAMDVRIRTQRAQLLCNQMPHGPILRAMARTDAAIEMAMEQSQRSLLGLLDDLFEYSQLLSHDDSQKRRRLAPASETDTLPDATDVWQEISNQYTAGASLRFEVIDRWSGRSVGSATAKKTLKALNQNIESQLQQVLADKDRLLKRIHTNRSTARQLGTKQSAIVSTVDDNIIDDSDFYQQQLRDLIESKASEASEDAAQDDPAVIARQWLATQQYHRKIKNRVDTRASKGRKIRYHAHPKLVNFMVPVPSQGMWHDEMRDVLFENLLGGGNKGAAVVNGHAKEENASNESQDEDVDEQR